MFDLGWTELLVIGIVALIVVGPKDLPGMFRAVGNFVGKAKRMARDFSKAMNDAADEAGVSDVQKTLRAASNPMKSALDDVKKSAESFTLETMNSGKPKLSPERAEAAEKIRQKSAEMATERLAKAPSAEQVEKTNAPDQSGTRPKGKPVTAKASPKTPAKKAAAKSAPPKAAPKTATATAKKPAAKPKPAKSTEGKA